MSKLNQMIKESDYFSKRNNILGYYNVGDLSDEGVAEEIKAELETADKKEILESYELPTGNSVEDHLSEEQQDKEEQDEPVMNQNLPELEENKE